MDEQSPPADLARDDSDAAGALERVRQRMLAAANQEVTVAGDEGDSGEPTPPQVGRYVVLDTLGAGGMGVVVRAYDPSLQREVALKRVLDAGRRGRARLLREAQAMARLHHPNVVSVFDVQARDEDIVIAMELVAGGDLRGWLCEKPAPEEIVARFLDAGRGLAAAHAVGLVHRDFKPANVLLDLDGTAKVGDFGLAKDHDTKPRSSGDSPLALEADALQTAAGVVMGTPRYMAPEQANGQGADARSDQYAFCVALWEALCGKPPFDGEDTTALQWSKMKGAPRWTGVRGVSARQAEALARGLNVDPTQRFEDMESLLEALRPRTFGRAALAMVGGSALAVAVGYAAWPSRDPCAEEAASFRDAWSLARVPLLKHLRSLAVPYAQTLGDSVETTLDDYADAWVEVHVSTCRSEAGQRSSSSETAACLDFHRARWDAVRAELGALDLEDAPYAERMVGRLGSPRGCESGEWTRWQGVDIADLSALSEIEQRVSDADLATKRGDFDAANTELSLARAAAGDDAALLRRVDLGAFSILVEQTRNDEAFERGDAAYRDALRDGDYVVAARLGGQIAVALLRLRDEGERAVELARTALDIGSGLGLQPSHRAAAHANLGLTLELSDEVEAAAEQYALAIELRASHGLTHNPNHIYSLILLARTRGRQGRFEEAGELADSAVSTAIRALGPGHPRAELLIAEAAFVLGTIGRLDDAEAHLRRALRTLESVYDADSLSVIASRDNLALILAAQGSFEEAVRLNRMSLEQKLRLFGEDHAQTELSRMNLAGALVASDAFEEALALLEVVPEAPVRYMLLGRAHQGLGQREEARRAFETGLRLAEQQGVGAAGLLVGLEVELAREQVLAGEREPALKRLAKLWASVNEEGKRHDGLQAQVAAAYVEALGDSPLAASIRAAGRKACLASGDTSDDCEALVGDEPAVLVGDDAR